MNSQIVVIVQGLIAGTFILWILTRKGSSPKPTVLNLTDPSVKQSKSNASHFGIKKYNNPNVVEEIPTQPKMLNVIFMWNGHSWDAFEVLGLPAGSPMEKVNQRYTELHSSSDDGQRLFLQAAKTAIENKTKI